ncbi:MAG: PEP-CTERM sorting domain-containing protein [Planctomycetota bacterium]
MKTRLALAALAAGSLLTASHANASFNLQITEMWPGNEPGDNLTSDWFEVTNFGTAAWTAATDGPLFFDDDSQDATAADPLNGIATIAPGESVVFVDDTDLTEWNTVWASAPSGLQVGTYDGSGLGGGGDGVTLFLDANSNGAEASEIIDFEAYPDADSNGGQSFDVLLGAFSTDGNAASAFTTAIVNDVDQPAIGSPGTVIPEPASLGLLAVGGLLIAGRRRRNN